MGEPHELAIDIEKKEVKNKIKKQQQQQPIRGCIKLSESTAPLPLSFLEAQDIAVTKELLTYLMLGHDAAWSHWKRC